jgi:YggT family protein
MNSVFQILDMLLHIARYVIVGQAILSWLIAFNVINTHNEFVRSIWQGLDKITEPLYRPIRKIMPDFGALDLSPLVVLLALQAIDIVLHNQFPFALGA